MHFHGNSRWQADENHNPPWFPLIFAFQVVEYMSPSPPARRVSYVIPPPAQSVPRLRLPRLGADRHGSTTPLFITSTLDIPTPSTTNVEFGLQLHPKHRLGITSFALDTTTRLSGKPTPEGILYSGGRDGQVLAHELGAPLKQRSKAYGVGSDGKGPARSWEAITGWGDPEESIEEEQAGESRAEIPFENTWELDPVVKEPALVWSLLIYEIMTDYYSELVVQTICAESF